MSQAALQRRNSTGKPALAVVGDGPSTLACSRYAATVWRSVDEIDRAAWNSLRAPDDLFMDLRLLRAVENSMSRDASFRYVLFRDAAGQPAASTCLCIYSVDGTLLADEGLARQAACALKRISSRLVTYKILFCGLPFSGGQSHLRFAPRADQHEIVRLLDRMLHTVAREAGASSIVLKEFESHELSALTPADQLGYLRADSLPMNELNIEQRTYDEYLASLHNRKRYEIRKSLKKLADGGVRAFVTSDANEIERIFTPRVHALYESVVSKATTKLELLPREFFLEMACQLPDNSEFCFLMQGDEALAFGLSLCFGRHYHPLFMGVDYDRNRDYDLYFNIMYRTVADAINRGADHVTLGQNADEFKRSKLGSFQTPRYFHIKGVGVVMQTVIRLLSKQLFPARPLLVTLPAPEPVPLPVRQSA